MFGPDKLNNAVASEKWDRVKIVCTQPFSKVTMVTVMLQMKMGLSENYLHGNSKATS